MRTSFLSPLLLLLACGGGEKADTADDAETGDSVVESLPEDPSPFTVHVTGADIDDDLVFDAPSCSSPVGSQNLRVFWRNASDAHAFVLLCEIMGDYTGPGTYSGADTTTRSKLQEEAGGEGRYYATDTTAGDEVTATIDGAVDAQVWGSWTVSGMRGDRPVTLDPATFPIWCASTLSPQPPTAGRLD